ncbi:hypothetical protein Hanom_Chr06g00579421 [Helianthus anomalus]
MATGWKKSLGNFRSAVGNVMGGLRGGSNLASWVVAGTLAYFLWIKWSQELCYASKSSCYGCGGGCFEYWPQEHSLKFSYGRSVFVTVYIAEILTPIKNLNFDVEGNIEVGWVTEGLYVLLCIATFLLFDLIFIRFISLFATAKRNNLDISESVIVCISDLAFKYAGIVPDLFVLKRPVCIWFCMDVVTDG